MADSPDVEKDPSAGWVERMARGDRDALGELFRLHASRLLPIGIAVLGSRSDAEEVLHEVFLQAFRHARDYDPSRGSVVSWLTVRMRSRCLDRRRSNPPSRHVPWNERLGELEAGPAESPLRDLEHERMRRALLALAEEQRTVLLLGYFEGLSSSEMAERLALPVGTVKSRVRLGLLRLRELLQDEPGGAS